MKSLRAVFLIHIAIVLNASGIDPGYNIRDYGASGDGNTLETEFIQAAIDDAYHHGGGIVEVPSGHYKIGTLFLKDNIELHLHPGAILIGSTEIRDYPEVIHEFESRTNGLYAKYFMIFAERANNISITGTGTIYGHGDTHFQLSRPQNMRPFMIRLVDCRQVTIKDVRLMEAANWTLHLLGCANVNVSGIQIENTGKGNRDGIDIDACQEVTVSNSSFSTTDDAIVLKSTCDILCQDIAISDCIIQSEASGIKTGTESNGGFKNITVSNCVIKNIPVHTGIELMTVDGGFMQNIFIDNIVMEDIATPIFIRLGQRARPYKKGQYVSKIEEVRNIHLSNITVRNAKLPSSIIGLHHKRIRNVSIDHYFAANSESQTAVAYSKVPFEEFSYPAASVFKNLPAYGFYCRNVNGLEFSRFLCQTVDSEERPALTFDRVSDVTLFNVRAEVKSSSIPMIYLRNFQKVSINYCRSIGFSESLIDFESQLQVSDDLVLQNNLIQENQLESQMVREYLEDPVFFDFEAEVKFSITNGELYQGLSSLPLIEGTVEVPMKLPDGDSFQLCLLLVNETTHPERIKVEYDGISQEFLVDWNKWGWAPITLLRNQSGASNLIFKIDSENTHSTIHLSKVYLRAQDIGFTD